MKLTRYIPILLILICTISISTIHHLTEEDKKEMREKEKAVMKRLYPKEEA